MNIPTNDEIISVSNSSNSASEACRRLGMPWRKYHRIALKLGCYKPNKGRKGVPATKRHYTFTLEDLNAGRVTKISNYQLKSFLFYHNLKEHKCEKCGIGEIWNGEPLVLQVHHIDGNHTNNRVSNILILCPNCHSQTDNFGSRNKYKYKEGESRRSKRMREKPMQQKTRHPTAYCVDCGKELSRWSSKRCWKCDAQFRGAKKRPSRKEFLRFFTSNGGRTVSIAEIARKYNVSGTSIYRWAEDFGIPITRIYGTKKKSIKYRKTREEAAKLRQVGCVQLTKDGQVVKRYESIKSVAKEGYSPKVVSMVITGIKKSYKGFLWKRISDLEG